MTDYKPGSRWKSSVCTAEFLIVRPPSQPGELQCGGAPVRPQSEAGEPAGEVSGEGPGVSAGKRYIDEATGMEVLGTKAGPGSLSIDGRALARKDAKPLPASD